MHAFQTAAGGFASVSQRRHLLSQNIQRWPSDDTYLISCLKDPIVPTVKCRGGGKSLQKSMLLFVWLGFLVLFLFWCCYWLMGCSTRPKQWLNLALSNSSHLANILSSTLSENFSARVTLTETIMLLLHYQEDTKAAIDLLNDHKELLETSIIILPEKKNQVTFKTG